LILGLVNLLTFLNPANVSELHHSTGSRSVALIYFIFSVTTGRNGILAVCAFHSLLPFLGQIRARLMEIEPVRLPKTTLVTAEIQNTSFLDLL
jgi:hypothetical protein